MAQVRYQPFYVEFILIIIIIPAMPFIYTAKGIRSIYRRFRKNEVTNIATTAGTSFDVTSTEIVEMAPTEVKVLDGGIDTGDKGIDEGDKGVDEGGKGVDGSNKVVDGDNKGVDDRGITYF